VDNVTRFLDENSRKMAEIYGEAFADPDKWGPDLAARLILAYIDRDRRDKFWYKKALGVKHVSGDSEKKLIVCSCHTGFLSHTGRTLMVAQKLRELGHDVVFAVDTDTKPDINGKPTQRRYSELIREADFKMYHFPVQVGEAERIRTLQTRGGSGGSYNAKRVSKECESILQVFKEIEAEKKKPDFMLFDSAWVARIPADIMNIPIGSLCNFLFTNYNRTMLTLPEEYPLRKAFLKVGGKTLVRLFERSRIGSIMLAILLVKYVIPYNLVRVKYMLKHRRWIGLPRNLYSQRSGHINLFPDYIAFGGMKISHRALPVGPITWEPEPPAQDQQRVSAFKEFLKEYQEKPLIYITMGSSGKLGLFQLIIEALKEEDCRVVITTGEQFDVSELGDLPKRFLVLPLYPGSEICAVASLVINHGGSGSVTQVIKQGTPQISIPTHVDQQWNSDLAVRAGLAKQIFPGDLTVESLREAIGEILWHSKVSEKNHGCSIRGIQHD